MKVTNTQLGPRGLNSKSGTVMIEPGASVEVEMEAHELVISKETGWFEFEDASEGKKSAAGGQSDGDKKADDKNPKK